MDSVYKHILEMDPIHLQAIALRCYAQGGKIQMSGI